jgi:tetratricopeptide (TPR) repeat protein
MTVQVAFELRNRATGGPAVALYVPTRDASAMLAVCARLGLDPSGRVYDLAGGFLLKLDRPPAELIPGATRLRELAADFYLPVDAELVPALLDDEAAGLVRDGGLVFLPGGRILRFDRRAAIDLGRLLISEPRPRRAWTPLPEPRRLAERVIAIGWEPPEAPPEALYREFEQDLRRPGRRGGSGEAGAGDDGRTERLDGSGEDGAQDPSTARTEREGGQAGGAPAGGFMPGVQGLAASFRGLMDRAGAGFSALREKLQWEWVDHSSLVRKLLHEFREGDPSRALRHAFSMAPVDARHRQVGWGNRLPWSRAIYSLLDLLSGPGRGQPIGVWRARSDLVDELSREYRKAAEQAIRQGDFRRAAYIHGKLLGDDRMAAHTLQRGGLHRDAAILYLKKLNDPVAAATAFEAAGAADRAIALYRQLGRHDAAGDLLRRIGEEDAAVVEYLRAAERAAAAVPPDYHASGMILKLHARRPDLAIEHFRKGWDQRPAHNATLCALELALILGVRGEIASIRRLLDEADAFFRSVGSDRDADTFYNTTTLMADATPAMAPYAGEVRDRALLTLAWRLRADVETGRSVPPAISTLFGGASSLWRPALVRDAEFAASTVQKQFRPRDREPSAGPDPSIQLVQIGHGTVTAVGQASLTREVFLGFDDGKVISFRPGRNQISLVAKSPGVVSALTVDADGQAVVALRQTEHASIVSCSLRRPDGTFRACLDGHFPALLSSWLTPLLPWGPNWLVGLGHGSELFVLDADSSITWSCLSIAQAIRESPTTALLLPAGRSPDDRLVLLTHDGPCWVLLDSAGRELDRTESAWCPAAPGARPLRCAPVAWNPDSPLVELVGLDKDGAVCVSEFRVEDERLDLVSSHSSRTEQTYLAATRFGSGSNTVVAVSWARIDWLSLKTDRFQPARSLPSPSNAAAVGCFFVSNLPEEILVVFADGTVARIDSSRRGSRSRGE